MIRAACAAGLYLALCVLAGCRRGPEAIADRFVEAYFVQASQEAALEVATGLAERKLHDELALVSAVRAGGYTAQQARSSVRFLRGEVRMEDSTAQVRYDLTVESPAGPPTRQALVLLRRVGGAWRVSNWSLFERAAVKPPGPPVKRPE